MSDENRNKHYRDPSRAQFGKAAEKTLSRSRKVGISTSELLQNAFTTPSTNVVAESLAILNSEASKDVSTAGPSNFGRIPLLSQTPRICENFNKAVAGESFRSTPGSSVGSVDAAGQAAFDGFVRGFHKLSAIECNQKATSSLKGRQPATASSSDIEDGTAVVALLSNPIFSIDDDPADEGVYAFGDHNGTSIIVAGSDSYPYLHKSPNTQVDAYALRLIPHSRNHSKGHELSDSFQEISNIQPWLKILNTYHDEVWGDMLPLAEKLCEEARVAFAGKESVLRDHPALRRLEMLLGHLEIPVS